MQIVRFFCYGLLSLAALLVGSGLIAQRSLIVLLHDTAFGIETTVRRALEDHLAAEFEPALNEALQDNLAVSYNNSFWLGTERDDSKQESVAFVAKGAQQVEVRFSILHHAIGTERVAVKVTLNETITVRDWTTADTQYYHVDLTTPIADQVNLQERPPDVHEITFALRDTSGEQPSNRVHVRCLISVVGLDEGGES